LSQNSKTKEDKENESLSAGSNPKCQLDCIPELGEDISKEVSLKCLKLKDS